jgi:hypothetical protein
MKPPNLYNVIVINLNFKSFIFVLVDPVWAKIFLLQNLQPVYIEQKRQHYSTYQNSYRRKTIFMWTLPLCSNAERKFEFTYLQISQWNYQICLINFDGLNIFIKILLTLSKIFHFLIYRIWTVGTSKCFFAHINSDMSDNIGLRSKWFFSKK